MRSRVVLVTALLAVLLAACGNAKTTVSNTGNTNGVTAHRIVVGGIASLTGPLPQAFAPVFEASPDWMWLR